MGQGKLEVSEILQLMDKMQETNLGKVEIDTGDFKLHIAAKKAPKTVTVSGGSSDWDQLADLGTQEADCKYVIGGAEGPTAIYATGEMETGKEIPSGNLVEAPIIGTYYAAPAPDKDPFVQVGQKVKQGDVLFIIESMKLMNEVQSEFDGEVVDILIENGSPVDYGQPIMVIK